MTTFSQLVDEAVAETQRPDLLPQIATYLNQTIREVHFRPDLNAPLTYRENFRESELVVDRDTGYSWDIPNPALFQRMAGVRFNSQVRRDGSTVWAVEKIPGPGLMPDEFYFYRVGSSLFFANYGGVGSVIDLGWFEFPSRLKYLPLANRPAQYDDIDGWQYADAVVSPEQQVAARLITSNWLLLRWHDVLLEGVRAKIYKRVSDDVRSRSTYSLYQQLRQGLWINEVVELGG